MKDRILFYAFTAALLLSFSACGDDSSSVDSRPSDNPELSEGNFDSLDELPDCGEENRGALARVKGTRYTCFTNAWVPVKEFVAGVCNIRACDSDVAGEFYYVESDKEAYQCASGTWKKSTGATFSDSEFVECYVSAIVTANVGSKDSLETCSSKREGDLAYVAGKLYACISKKWQKQTAVVISESDLGKCAKDGDYKFVLSKSASYSCKDGAWLKDGKAVSVASSSSSSKTLSSSSSEKHSSSSSVEEKKSSAEESSSSKAPDKELPVDDGTKVRGVCIVSEKSIVRDSNVTYSFYNMGGTSVTFSWDFGDRASPATSQEISPTVTYKRGGVYYARLIINEGRESESDTIICSKVKVSGIPVTDCLCETQTDTLQVSEDFPDSATWKISGCKGGQEFTYEWEGSANYTWNLSSDSSSIVGVTTKAGLFSPDIEIVNDESESMFISCPAVYVKGIVSATCSMNMRYDEDGNDDGYTFSVRNFKNVGELKNLSMILSGDDGYSKDVTISVRDYYYWDWESASYVIPKSAVPDLHTYTLTYGKYDVCSVTPIYCGASEKSVFRKDTSHWGLIGVGDYTATSYLWNFIDGNGNGISSTDAKPKIAFEETGTVYASVVLDEGLESERTISCSNIKVEKRSISNCSCELNLVSESDSITESNEVVFEWNVTGCESEGAEPFIYTWNSGYDATDASVIRTFTNRGKYTPNVTVENQDGSTATPQCPTATVKGVLENEGTMTDVRDGKVYRTVKIGEQTWMAENLNYDTTGAVCFENSPDNCEKYGRLYSASLAQVVCPEGWHLPSKLEFETLLDSAGGFDNLKSSEWDGEDDSYGFSALPAGKYDYVSGTKFTTDQFATGWWLYTEMIDYLAPLYGVYVGYGPRFTDDDNENGFSVRCLED